MFMPAPRGLRDPAAVNRRLQMLDEKQELQRLRRWADEVQKKKGLVPFFDPADAGVDAQVLVLLEAPGPMTNTSSRRPGSGFISIDNDDQTAANCWHARQRAGLGSDVTLHWNIVPWYLGPARRKPNRHELAEGAQRLRELVGLLKCLKVVITCGRYAQRGWNNHLNDLDYKVLPTWHPSPLALRGPERREHFLKTFVQAAELVRPIS